jgi:hypothetical protein
MKGDNMEIEKLLKDNREYSLDVLVGLKEKPWEYEPNYYKFWHKNLPCWIKRMARGGGQLNGYTGIPIVQKIMNTNIINTNGEFEYFDYKIHEDNECIYDLFNQNIRVHGGLTYSNFKEGYLILGFDTGHDGDYCPYLDELIKNTSTYIPSIPPLKSLRRSKATYKTFRYVYENCTALADQLYNLLGLNKIEKYYSRFYDELKLNYKYMDFGLFCRESGEINIL